MNDDQIPTLGRGRGRGVRADDAASTSSKRSGEKEQPSTGNGQKRGNGREDRAVGIHKTRPPTAENTKQGTTGKVLSLSANYFKLIRQPRFEFCEYRVDFEPEIDNERMRSAFIAQQRETLGGYLYDRVNVLFLTRRLEQEPLIYVVESREGATYTITIKFTNRTIQMTDTSAMQVLNVLLRRAMDGLKMQLVGRNLYDPQNKVLLNQFKVELWPGYITSIRQHEHDILVCSEVSHKVMRQETIYDILRSCKRDDPRGWQDSFKKQVIGSIVLTGYNNHTYRVDDVDFASSPQSTFNQKGVEVSYHAYYSNRYSVTINDRAQPMLVSNPKARDIRDGRGDQVIFLVPELCRATGLTDAMRSNFTMMRGMAEHTQMDPMKRRDRLLALTRRLHSAPESMQQLNNFNTNLDTALVSFPGRALPQEVMQFGGNRTFQNDDRVDWTNSLRSGPMYQAIPLKRWVYIVPKKLAKETEIFIEALVRVAQGMNYEMAPPRKIEIVDDRLHTYVKEIEGIASKDPALIMIVVPTNAADRYAAIKVLTCVKNAIPTQVIVAKTMTPKKGDVMSIATKVMIQLNCKLGGAPWMIKFPVKGVMAIGFDVTHDTRDRSKSFGAFVASMDLQKNVQFYSAVSAHTDGAEISNNISNHTNNALREFKKLHGELPDRIFFYRDGVGDGQIKQVHEQEVQGIQKMLDSVYGKHGEGRTPKFSFIIVNKRLNTRIFLNQGSRVANPASGTVVDDVITLPERYDFFLVSQSVRQGTVAPTSYNVIHDTNGLTPDRMQILTYKYTHLYYNWSGCVRVPAVVQYAHKLAFLVGTFLHEPPQQSFNQKLYFL